MTHRRCVPLLLAVIAATGACKSGDGVPAVSGPTAPKLELSASEMRYDPASTAVARGAVSVVLHNRGAVIHDLRIDGKPTFLLEASPAQTSTATWQLDQGRYRIYCSLPGHRAAGMEGVLEVR